MSSDSVDPAQIAADPVTERARIVAELIGRILRGDVKATIDASARDSGQMLKARAARGLSIGPDGVMPAAFTMAQLHSLFDPAGNNSRQEIARHSAAMPLFEGLAGAFDPMASAVDTTGPATQPHIEAVFSKRTDYQEARGRVAVRRDLSLHRAFDVELKQLSQTTSVWDKLLSVGLSPRQLRRVLNCLAYVREGFALQRGKYGLIDADQKGNWVHTIDELDAVLDRTKGRSFAEIERATMAMFGDAWKTKFNFTRHNYDGAAVARIVLTRELDADFTAADVDGIVEANKEHQISPPGLMSILYINKIAGLLNAQRSKLWGELLETSGAVSLSSRTQSQLAYWTEVAMEQDYRQFQLKLLRQQAEDDCLTDEEAEIKQRLEDRSRFGSFVTDDDFAALVSLQKKIADPYKQQLSRTAEGGMMVAMSRAEIALLALSGISAWHVPHDSTPWYWLSRTGVVADILANLGLGGRYKLTRLNGPETNPVFQFGTIRECLDSGLKTYADICKILSEEELQYVHGRLGSMEGAVKEAMSRTAKWLKNDTRVRLQEEVVNIPFWDTPLKYPDRGVEESLWWEINGIPEAQRSLSQQQFWLQHRFDGLNAKERSDYERAIRIRNTVVEELGQELRRDNKYIPDFKPVMRQKAFS